MSDFLNNLVTASVGQIMAVRPRLPALFEPLHAMQTGPLTTAPIEELSGRLAATLVESERDPASRRMVVPHASQSDAQPDWIAANHHSMEPPAPSGHDVSTLDREQLPAALSVFPEREPALAPASTPPTRLISGVFATPTETPEAPTFDVVQDQPPASPDHRAPVEPAAYPGRTHVAEPMPTGVQPVLAAPTARITQAEAQAGPLLAPAPSPQSERVEPSATSAGDPSSLEMEQPPAARPVSTAQGREPALAPASTPPARSESSVFATPTETPEAPTFDVVQDQPPASPDRRAPVEPAAYPGRTHVAEPMPASIQSVLRATTARITQAEAQAGNTSSVIRPQAAPEATSRTGPDSPVEGHAFSGAHTSPAPDDPTRPRVIAPQAQVLTRIEPVLSEQHNVSADSISSPRETTRSAEPAPVVRVTIGRIEVRAVMPSQPPVARPAARRFEPRLSLDEYLKQQHGGGQ